MGAPGAWGKFKLVSPSTTTAITMMGITGAVPMTHGVTLTVLVGGQRVRYSFLVAPPGWKVSSDVNAVSQQQHAGCGRGKLTSRRGCGGCTALGLIVVSAASCQNTSSRETSATGTACLHTVLHSH